MNRSHGESLIVDRYVARVQYIGDRIARINKLHLITNLPALDTSSN